MRVYTTIVTSLVALIGCVLGLTASGCDSPTSSNNPATVNKVSVRLQWFPTAQFAGFYLAQAENYYRDAQIDATLNSGGPDFNAISLVANGSDQFGVWTADQLLMAVSKDVPVTIVAAIYRKDPNVLMAKGGSGIRGPKDFPGKTVSTVYGRATESVLLAMLKRENVDPKSVNIVPFPFTLQTFMAGEVDVSAAYSYDHPYQARKLGMEVDIIDPADYGINFYSDCLFVRNDLIETDPDLVERFVHATLKGWESAMQSKDAALDAVLKVDKGLDRATQSYMLESSESLIRHEAPDRIGLVSGESLQKMVQTLAEQELLPTGFDANKTYTNRFVESYYAKRAK